MQSANLFSNMGRAVIDANFAYLTFALCRKNFLSQTLYPTVLLLLTAHHMPR